MRKRNSGQTLVIGFLLLLGLAVGVLVFIQVSVFPDINKQAELDAQGESVKSMTQLRASLQSSLATGVSQTVILENEVDYAPQPAAPPNQYAQLSFVDGEMSVENAEIKVGEEEINGTTYDVTERMYIDKENDREYLPNITTTYQLIPNYIEISSTNRNIKMDNTVIYEDNPAGNRVKHSGQSIISGRHISLVAVETTTNGVKKQQNIDLNINPKSKISGKIRGTNSGGDDIVITMKTTEDGSSEWANLATNNDNVISATDNGDTLEIVLDGTPDNAEYYEFNFMRADLRF